MFLYAALNYLSKKRGSHGNTIKPSVYLVCSNKTRPHAEKIVENLQPLFTALTPRFEYIEASHSDIEDIYSKLKDKLFHDEGLPKGIYYVDLTGGTKAMSSALMGLAYTASLLSGAGSVFYLFYVEAPQENSCKNAPASPFTSKIKLQGNPLEIFGDYTVKSVIGYIRAFAFEKAEEIIQKLTAQPPASSEFKDTVKALTRISDFTKSLAMLNFVDSIKVLEDFLKDMPSGEVYRRLSKEGIHINEEIIRSAINEIEPLRRLRKNGNPLRILEDTCKTQHIENCPYTEKFSQAILILAYILYLVGLTWEKKFPALSVQLYYRAIEMSLQSYLLKKGIWAGGDTPLSKIEQLNLSKDVLDSLKAKVETKSNTEPIIKLSLYDDAQIINDLEGDFPDFQNLNNYTQTRNKSIIAHGLEPPIPGKKGNFDKLRSYAYTVISYIADKTNASRTYMTITLVQELLGIKAQ